MTTARPAASSARPSRRLLRVRLAVMAGGGLALVLGLSTGLARAGVGQTVAPAGAHGLLMAAGGACWVAAATLWALGRSPIAVAPLLAGFLVLTIVGERLELSRLRAPTAAARRPLLLAAAVFGLGVVATPIAWSVGLVVMGLGLLAQTSWLARHDVARITIHRPGLPRFAAACMLAGYGWMAVGGLLWFAVGAGAGLPLLRDAALHALFLGFVMSMVMGHAPIILPAVLTVALPYHPTAWVPLALLHGSLAVRVAADLPGSAWLRAGAAVGNVTALVLFVVLAAVTIVFNRRPRARLPDSVSPKERSVVT